MEKLGRHDRSARCSHPLFAVDSLAPFAIMARQARGGAMTLSIRSAEPSDVPAIAAICFDAFQAIAGRHGFPPDIPNLEAATGVMSALVAHPGVFGVVAEQDGRVVGSNFVDERNPISGIGPVTVDPAAQDGRIGRALMRAALARSVDRRAAGVRLVQAAYHTRSLALYTKLGFDARALLACMQGPPLGEATPGFEVRPAIAADQAACNALCERVHGHGRAGELADAIAFGQAVVVERAGRISGYATAIAFFGHAVGETSDDLKALIAAAPAILGAGILVPMGNGALIRWCLDRGLRITQTMTLMSIGLYNQPSGAWLPSIIY
jgi:predicted N-acetyltransferase YhbS